MAATLAALGAALRATYLAPLAALPAAAALPACRNNSVDVALTPVGAPFDQVVITEDLAVSGQVVAAFSLEVEFAAAPGLWAPLPGSLVAGGSTVGARATALTGAAVSGASRLRFTCTASVDPADATPVTISTFSAFLSAPPPAPPPAGPLPSGA